MAYPHPQSGAPTSFKTNVNRAKTKRWVEAKSYSYDGDDWGDADDFDEYNDPPTSAPPKPTGLRQRGQSATNPTQVPSQTYQISSQGVRSVTNPQPQHNSQPARSNSFDRGDERRVFSGPNLQQTSSSPVELAQQSNYPQQRPDKARSQQGSDQRATVQQALNQPPSSQNASYGILPNQGLPTSSSSSDLVAGKEQVRSPTEIQANQQPTIQSEPVVQQSRAQVHMHPDQPPQRTNQTYLPIGYYQVGSGLEQASQQNLGGVTHSTESINPTPAFENRQHLYQLESQAQSQTAEQPSLRHSSESVSSSSFPPRKSSLSHGLPNPPQAPTGVPLGPSGGASHSPREQIDNTDSEKPPMFVRPAEIYKRMQDERERERRAQDLPAPILSSNIINTTDSPVLSPSGPESGHAKLDVNEGKPSSTQEDNSSTEAYPFNTRRPNMDRVRAQAGFDSTLRPVLPDVTRMSSFGDIFSSSTSNTEELSNLPPRDIADTPPQATPPIPSQQTGPRPLQHQQSIGLRSVVHQAFDTSEDQIPATPSSVAGSGIARSASGGTSVISPIISRGPSISRTIPNTEKEGNTLTDLQAELDETSINNSTPKPSSRSANPRQMPENASPSQRSALNTSDILPPNFIPGHRRDTSTPSPNNSPARTPALESSKLAQPLFQAELAVVTPTEPTHFEKSDSQVEDPALPDESESNRTKSGDDAKSRLPADWKPLNLEARASNLYVPSAVDASVKREEGSISGSPSTPSKDPSTSRPDSPSKNRVRDLAGKFESNSSSRRNSNHSISQPNTLLGPGGQRLDTSPTRPGVDRLESFRPRLPGAWESFSSNAPKGASLNRIEKDGPPPQVVTSSMLESSTDAPLPSESVPSEPQTKTVVENKDVSFIDKAQQATQDSFAAAAAAGVALAGALTAAVGMNQDVSRTEPVNRASSNENEAKYSAEVAGGTKKGRNFSMDTALHPEASRPARPESTGDDVSSETPTPPPSKDLSESTDYVQNNSKHHLPVASAKDAEVINQPVVENSWNNRSQAMLPPLSTDIGNHQYESDRLRREIVKNLSPLSASEPTTAESESPWQDSSKLSAHPDVQAYGRDSMVIPKEYDSYWNGSNSGSGMSQSDSPRSRPQSMSTSNQVRDVHITPPKPLQLGRATQHGDEGSHEHVLDESKQAVVDVPQYSREKEHVDISLPAHQPLDIQTNDTSTGVRENVQGISELPAIPHVPDITSQPYQIKDQKYISPDENRRASATPTLLANEHVLYRTRTETEELPQSHGVIAEPTSHGTQRSTHSPHQSWAPEQSTPTASSSNFGYTDSPQSSGRAAGATYRENSNLDLSPTHHQVRPEPLSKSSRTSVPTDKDYDLPSPPPPVSAQPKIRAFREIMNLKNPEERIEAYNKAREQVANQNTGLAHWLVVKSREWSEHADILSQRPLAGDIGHKSLPSRSKLSGLRPGGGQPAPQPYYQQYLGASQQNLGSEAVGASNVSSGGSQGFSPGGAGGKKTKDFLHSAGLGAKGLFSKGKNKLRGGGGADKVSSSSLNPDSRGMQPQSEPGLQPQIDSPNLLQQLLKQRLVSEQSQFSRPHLGPQSSIQDNNLEKTQRPLQPRYLNPGEQHVLSASQSLSYAQNKSSSLVSGPPTSSTLTEDRHLSQQTAAQFVSRDEPQHSGTVADTRISRENSTEISNLSSKNSAADFSGPLTDDLDRSRPDQSAATLLAPSHLKPAPDAPRLPYPDVGGLFHEGWDDQREKRASQVANWRYSQPHSTPEISISMPHVRGNSEQPRGISPNTDNVQNYQFPSQPDESVQDELSSVQGPLLTAQSSFVMEDHTQNSKHRPFSFMELSSSRKTHEPVPEILQHVRRNEAKSSGGRYDRDPSPVSPQRSMHDQAVTARRSTSDDFIPSEKQLELATQSSPFLFQDPNLHEHPAFRHGTPPVNGSSLGGNQVPVETPRRISAVQQQQFPPAVPPHGVIANSWRNPNDPPSLPALLAPTRAEEPRPITRPGHEDSQLQAPAAPKVKAKRGSLFRSLNRRGSKDLDSGRDPQEPTASPLATRIEPRKTSGHHEKTKADIKTSESKKAHNKLQRSSSAAIPEQESGKKKRFSVLGSLFGRSNQDKIRPKPQVVHPNPPIQHATPPGHPPASNFPDVRPTSNQQPQQPQQHRQQQGHFFAPQEYYAQPIQGEFYAPGRQFDVPPTQPRQSTRPSYQRASDSSAYVQDAALRQGNMAQSHNVNPTGERSSTKTAPITGLRQPMAHGGSTDSRHSSLPASRRHDVHNNSTTNDSGLMMRSNNSPQRTGQSFFANQPQSEYYSNTPYHEPHFPQNSRQQPTTYPLHNTYQKSQSPPPPPPPAKDDLSSAPRHDPSLAPNTSPQARSSPYSPIPISHIQTTTAAKAPSEAKSPQEKAEMRKSRQMEIEHGISKTTESNAGSIPTTGTNISAGGNGTGNGSQQHPEQKRNNEIPASDKLLVKMEEEEGGGGGGGGKRRDSSDSEVVVMSSTSYPGMEWQPREFSRWDGRD